MPASAQRFGSVAPHPQADKAKQAAAAAQQRLAQLQERCAAEEARLGALQGAVAEQRRSFNAQVQALLELGQQVPGRGACRCEAGVAWCSCRASCPPAALEAAVLAARLPQVKAQSEELARGYSELQAAQAAAQAQQERLEGNQAEVEAQRTAAQADRAEAEAAARAAAEAQLAAAAEQRKLGQERLESLRAAEVARELQLRLAVQVRAAVAAGVPGAEALWQQVGAAAGATANQLPAAPPAELGGTFAAALPPACSATMLFSAAPPPPRSPGLPAQGQPAVELQPAGDSARYRALLSDLESSIDRWRTQLRAGQPLTFGDGLGGVAFTPGWPLGGAGLLAGLPGSPDAKCSLGGRCSPAKPMAAAEQRQQEAAPAAEAQGGGRGGEDGLGVEPSSPSKAVQTAVSYLDEVPHAFVERNASRGGTSSVPCSPARHRGGLGGGAPQPRPASASVAVRGGKGGGSGGGSPTGSFTAGQVRAVSGQGLVIGAEFSLPGSPQTARPRKWLKFKARQSADGEAPGGGRGASGDQECGSPGKGGAWGRGIFAFRRSADGASKQ